MVSDGPNRQTWSLRSVTVAIIVLLGAGGMFGVVQGAERRTDGVERVAGLDEVLASDGDAFYDAQGQPIEVTYEATNYLLVGSDSRSEIDTEGEDRAAIGSAESIGGQRSDTIMVLRTEANGSAALLSIPRDLWVPIAGTDGSQRINTAFNDGPETLIATVTDALGIPITHYVEVNFDGFKDIVDTIGGVEICVEYMARDTNSGLALDPGCHVLDGVQSLAYARSRYYQEWDGESWVEDGTGDRGRVERQQLFIRAAANGALQKFKSDPFTSGDTIDAVIGAVTVDDSLDPLYAARALRQAVGDGLATYVLPTYDDTVGDADVLRLSDDADVVLDYFRGVGPPPIEYETGASTASTATED